MNKKGYSKAFKLQVTKEALRPENQGLEHIVAEKYGIMPTTVIKWKNHFLELGEEQAFKKGTPMRKRKTPLEIEQAKKIAELEEEIEILKKAAAFLANVKRD